MEQNYYSKRKVMLLTLQFKQLLKKTFLSSTLLIIAFTSQYVNAQCPSPTPNTPPITSSVNTGGNTVTVPYSGTVTYVNGDITFGTTTQVYIITISPGTTWVISAGSHLRVQNLNVLGTLILQEGATVSCGTLLPYSEGTFNVNSGGIVKMCTNTAIENCGATVFGTSPALTYVGEPGGKAVVSLTYKYSPSVSGTVNLSQGGASNSSNITIVIDNPASVNYLFTYVGSPGASPLVFRGTENNLPFNVRTGCGALVGQTAACNAGNTAPIWKE